MSKKIFYDIMKLVIKMGIEDVKNSLDKNANLTDDVKADLFELVLLFQKNYEDVSLSKLASRLSDVKVEVVGKFISEEVALYNDKTNCIQINEKALEESEDTKFILMTTLVQMMQEKEKDPKGLLDTVQKGYAKIVAHNLIGSEDFTHTEIYVNQLGSIAGDALESSVWTGDPAYIVSGLEEKGIAPDQTVEALEAINYDAVTSPKTGKSNFASIQHTLTDMAMRASLSEKSMEMLEEYIVEDPNLLGKDMEFPNLGMYQDLELLRQYQRGMNERKENSVARAM